MNTLPPVGTNALLELLAPYVPDDAIAQVCPRAFTGGRRHELSAPQLWRVHLLAVLTSTHSLNLLAVQLPEQPAWRRFARLRRALPTPRMLHEFRAQVGVSGLRRINQHLLGRLLCRREVQPHAVALMDATDLPAACSGFKKKFGELHGHPRGAGWADAQDGAESLVCRLQEAHPATVVANGASVGDVGAVSQLGDPCQCVRRRTAPAQLALVSPASGLVAGHRGGGHGLFVSREQSRCPHRLADGGGHQTAGRHAAVAAVHERRAGRMPTGAAFGMVGIRAADATAMVSRPRTSRILRSLLAGHALSAPFRI